SFAEFPGPFWSRISPIPLVLQCRKAQRSKWVLRQHEKYGHIVRIAPNHISIDVPEAIDTIYGHKTGFTKGPFYEDKAHVSSPVLFNTRNVQIHQRKRKYINPAFSARNLQDFVEYMNPSISRIVQVMRNHASNLEPLRFLQTANFLAFDVIGQYAFCSAFGFLKIGRDDLNLIHTVDTRGEVLNTLGNLPTWIRPYIKYLRFDPFWLFDGIRSTANLESIGRAAFERRGEETNCRKDLMSFLLNAKDPETGGPLSTTEIVAEVISFIVGGSDTTSSTMTNFMDFISRDQTLQDSI
ncbi:cytochrome P450, partial [Rhexocercosporidium sp. MPI-PUGE-AT-0058]